MFITKRHKELLKKKRTIIAAIGQHLSYKVQCGSCNFIFIVDTHPYFCIQCGKELVYR